MSESNVTFTIGDHASFEENGAAEGSLNFLLYSQSNLAVPVLIDNNNIFSVGTARLIPINTTVGASTFNFIDDSENSQRILQDMLTYRIIPYLLDVNNFIIYTFSHQDKHDILVWINTSIKKSLKIPANPSTTGIVIDEDESLNWIDF